MPGRRGFGGPELTEALYMWPGLVKTAKEEGIDVFETYVFWNGHELSPGNYYFGGRYDLLKFVKIVQQVGMYLILRIGPFLAAEWNFGGVLVWLHYVPGTVFRTNSEPFKYHMQKFMTLIANIMKKEKLFASQGGPINMAQVALCNACIRIAKTCPHIWKPESLIYTLLSSEPCLSLIDCFQAALSTLGPDYVGVKTSDTSVVSSTSSDKRIENLRVGGKWPIQDQDICKSPIHREYSLQK